jgi:hypothetical protein
VSIRRTSGEIVNATLLEIFLSLVFIVFALAVWERQRADAAEARAAKVVSSAASQADVARRATALADTLRQTRAAHRVMVDSIGRALDSLKFMSREPTNCEADETSPEFLTVILAGPQQLRVTVNRSQLAHSAGTVEMLTPVAFVRRFADVRAYSLAHGCRYRARVVDSDAVAKADYKRGLAAVYTTFRARGFLQ